MRRAPLLLAGVSLVIASTSGVASGDTSTTTTSPTSIPVTTTTVSKGPVAPLTGLSDPTRISHRRSALTIKVDNTPEAHPQWGLTKADVIYEEIVEGDITRLALIFNSHLPQVVGPVRSVRRTDAEIVWPLRGIFAFSGGAQYAIDTIEHAPVKLFDQSNAGSAMYRDLQRPAPHNLLANPVALMAMGGPVHVPPALFTYVARSAPPRGAPVGSFTVNFEAGYATSYRWNATTKSWDRSIFGAPDVTATGQRVSPTNVVVMSVNYKGGVGVEGSEAVLTGTGPVEVFSDGRVQKGHWFRSTINKVTAYRSNSGQVIALRPGQTLVELLATGWTVSAYAPAR